MPLLKLVVCRDYEQAKRYLQNLGETSNMPWKISFRHSVARFEDSFIRCMVFRSLEDIRGTGMQLNSIEFLTCPPPDIFSYIMSRLRCFHDWP